MADGTRIEWVRNGDGTQGATWNVVSGCTKCSEGCLNCYITRTPPFRIRHRTWDRDGIGGTTGVLLHPDRVTVPLGWRKPRTVFVCSLADLFHRDVPDEYIARVFAVMALTPQHTYKVLTKRHGRMRALLSSSRFTDLIFIEVMRLAVNTIGADAWRWDYPLPNVHLGVTAENQEWADRRILALLATPAAVRWVSAEPLVGPVSLHRYLPNGWSTTEPGIRWNPTPPHVEPSLTSPTLDWTVIGGESGPGARPMQIEWAETIVRQCQDADVPVFMKQLGSVTGGKHHQDIDTFPDHLRVREYPITAAVSAGL
jgi:protein gp37